MSTGISQGAKVNVVNTAAWKCNLESTMQIAGSIELVDLFRAAAFLTTCLVLC